MNWKLINIGLVWTAITTTVSALFWMMSAFASAGDLAELEARVAAMAPMSEVQEIQIDVAYGQFYDRLDDYEEALDEDRQELADEYKRQMERLRAKICKVDPEWERCDDSE